MGMRPEQADRELETFSGFIEVAGLPVEQGSIRKHNPPYPDISCRIKDLGQVAFELVEIVDPEAKQRLSESLRLKDRVERMANALPPEKRRALSISVGDASIGITARKDVARQDFAGAIASLLDQLLWVPPGHRGPFRLDRSSPAATAFESVDVFRGVRGPLFDAIDGGWVHDPTVEIIKQKFGKRYVCEVPVELLAYHGFPYRFEAVKPSLQAFLEDGLQSSSFRRVWVYSRMLRRILYPA